MEFMSVLFRYAQFPALSGYSPFPVQYAHFTLKPDHDEPPRRGRGDDHEPVQFLSHQPDRRSAGRCAFVGRGSPAAALSGYRGHPVSGSPHHPHRYSGRSEEHTSELQSLMRISYAVFCLKKKKYKPLKTIYIHVMISMCHIQPKHRQNEHNYALQTIILT